MPTNITDTLSITYQPKAALIVFEAEKQVDSKNEYYIETRKIDEKGRFSRPAPVTRKFVNALIKNFSVEEEKMPHGPMPSNMLFADPRSGHERYVWWNPPQKRALYFSKGHGINDDSYNMPGVVYLVESGRLSVFAFAGKKATERTPLLYGPFFNYYSGGGICLGSAKVDWPSDVTWQTIQEHWEKMFWASINSHTMHNPMKEGRNLIIALKNSIEKPFDTDLLLPVKKFVKDLLK